MSHSADVWKPTPWIVGTEPAPAKIARLQPWKFPPTTVCCRAFGFDVSRPAVEHANQKQLRNRFSDPMKPECPISTPIAPPSKNMSAKGVRLERRTSGRPVPIEIERLAAAGGSQPHALEARVAAAVRDKYGPTRRSLLNLRHEAACSDDASAVQIFDRQRRGSPVVPRRDVDRLVLPHARAAMRRVGWTEAMVERCLQRGGVVGRKVTDGAEPAVL